MKNVIKLNHYFCPSELEKAINEWVDYYNEKDFMNHWIISHPKTYI